MTVGENTESNKKSGFMNIIKPSIFYLVLSSLLIFFYVGYPKPGFPREPIRYVIEVADKWWISIENENPNYYEEIDLGKVLFHLCGSREKLAEVYNGRYPDTPFDLNSNVYMFVAYGKTPPAHVWLVVKVRDGKVVLHKWAAGHETVRLLSCFTDTLTNADDY